MKLSFKRILRLARRYIMSVRHEPAEIIFDPPQIDPGEEKLPVGHFDYCIYTAQEAALRVIINGKPGPALKLGTIAVMEHCKERQSPHHEFIRAEIRQDDGKYYWIVIQRGTDFQPIDDASGRSSPSNSQGGTPEENRKQASPLTPINENTVASHQSLPNGPPVPASAPSFVASTLHSIMSFGRSRYKSAKAGSTKFFGGTFVFASKGSVMSADNVTRHKNRKEVVRLARPQKKYNFDILLTAYFDNPSTAPNVGDLVLAASVVSKNIHYYSYRAMCYTFAMWTFELIRRSPIFKDQIRVEKEPDVHRRGRFYGWLATKEPDDEEHEIKKTKRERKEAKKAMKQQKKMEKQARKNNKMEDDFKDDRKEEPHWHAVVDSETLAINDSAVELLQAQKVKGQPATSQAIQNEGIPSRRVEFYDVALDFNTKRTQRAEDLGTTAVKTLHEIARLARDENIEQIGKRHNEEIAKKDADLAKANARIAALEAAQSGSSTEISQISSPQLAAGPLTEASLVI